jgi:hypothetical protein
MMYSHMKVKKGKKCYHCHHYHHHYQHYSVFLYICVKYDDEGGYYALLYYFLFKPLYIFI